MLKRHPDPSSPLARAASLARGIVAGTILFSLLLLTNVVQTASVVFAPVRPGITRWINRWCAQIWWGICVFYLERLYGLRLVFTGERLRWREDAIVIANHQQMSDIPALMCLAWRMGRLGDMKWIVKDPLKWVPGIGWGMYFLGCVFVKRLWAEDKEHVERTFSYLNRNRVPLWLVAFPEGTRITEKKLERSRSFAAKAGMRAPENVLIPRTKGFTASVEGLRGHAAAVYDVTIGFPEGIPTLWQLFKGDVREIHLHTRRYPVASLPADREALGQWLLKLYEEKDARMGEFRRVGHFTGPRYEQPYWGRPAVEVNPDTGRVSETDAMR